MPAAAARYGAAVRHNDKLGVLIGQTQLLHRKEMTLGLTLLCFIALPPILFGLSYWLTRTMSWPVWLVICVLALCGSVAFMAARLNAGPIGVFAAAVGVAISIGHSLARSHSATGKSA